VQGRPDGGLLDAGTSGHAVALTGVLGTEHEHHALADERLYAEKHR
jgi:hypothetical protein